MSKDSIFRLASLTKLLTCTAAMMLVEAGEIFLDDPVSRHIPEFAGLTPCPNAKREHPIREATVHDLFRHTAGFTYGEFGSSAVHESYRRLNLLDNRQTSREMVEKLSIIPLAHAPGTTFEYGMSTDVLGHIMERLKAQALEAILQSLIAIPLGLHDTSFLFDRHFSGRVAQPARDPATGTRPWMPVYQDDSEEPPKWHSGGGGLLSTAHDYYVFLQTLLDDLVNGQGCLLAPKTLTWMTSNHLPRDVAYGEYMPTLGLMSPTPDRGQGFGLGFLVRMETGRNSIPGSVGDFSWAGVSGTYAWVDPVEQLIAVFMMQAPKERHRYRALTRHLVYQALLKGCRCQ